MSRIDVKLIKIVFMVFLICIYTVKAHESYYTKVVHDDYSLSSEQNEVPTDCVSPCPKTCANLITNTPCELTTCYPGYECKLGFYRDDNGNCVSAKKCKCQDPNAVVTKNVNMCPGGTCDKRFYEHCHTPPLKYGCKCRKGFVKDAEGLCVHKKSCCPAAFQVYSLCGPVTECEPTCNIPQPNPNVCTLVKLFTCATGCFCKNGHIRDSTGNCILQTSCSCGTNEEYSSCGPTTEATCAARIASSDHIGGGCFCLPGFIRQTTGGSCIPVAQCPCGLDEISTLYGPTVQATCTTRISSTDFNGIGCYCRPGFIRLTIDGACVAYAKCPCGSYEEYKLHGPSVQATCDTRISSNDDTGGGCYCIPGYIRSTNVLTEGQCILISQCDCGSDEIYRLTGPSIEATCDAPYSSNDNTGSKCFCKPNYIRLATGGKCVPINECPCTMYPGLPSEVEFVLDAPVCPYYCIFSDYYRILLKAMCVSTMKMPGCVCKNGVFAYELVGSVYNFMVLRGCRNDCYYYG